MQPLAASGWGLDEQRRALLVRWNDLCHLCWAVWGCCLSVVLHPAGQETARALQTLGVISPLTAISWAGITSSLTFPHTFPHTFPARPICCWEWLNSFHRIFQSRYLPYFFKICFLHRPSIWSLNIHVFSVLSSVAVVCLWPYNIHSWIW